MVVSKRYELSTYRKTLLAMHAEGLSNAEIARRLAKQGVKSPRGTTPTQAGVGFHIRELLEKKANVDNLVPAKEAKSDKKAPLKQTLKDAIAILESEMDPQQAERIVQKLLNS